MFFENQKFNVKIGIGGDLTVAPLPHHRAYGPYTAVRLVEREDNSPGFRQHVANSMLNARGSRLGFTHIPCRLAPIRVNCSMPSRTFRILTTPFTPLREDRLGLWLSPTTPAADFYIVVRKSAAYPVWYSRHDADLPRVSLTAFIAHWSDLPHKPLMDMGFIVCCQLARSARPQIRFLYVRLRFWLHASFRPRLHGDGPCALLILHLHQVG